MKSRYGYIVVSICWMGLAGCAGWKNQMGEFRPGNAARMGSVPPPPAAPIPPTAPFGDPPPPSAPLMGPADSAPPRLNLSSVPEGPSAPARSQVASADSAKPAKLYNLEDTRSKSSSAKKSSALSKLASAAGTSVKKTEKVVSSSADSTVKKLTESASRADNAAAEVVTKVTEPLEPQVKTEPLPAPVAVEAPASAAAPAAAPAAEPAPAPAPAIDAADLLVEPVRKGADSGSKSTGPQSKVLPGSKFFNGKNKPMIYPVSNPANSEPIPAVFFS